MSVTASASLKLGNGTGNGTWAGACPLRLVFQRHFKPVMPDFVVDRLCIGALAAWRLMCRDQFSPFIGRLHCVSQVLAS